MKQTRRCFLGTLLAGAAAVAAAPQATAEAAPEPASIEEKARAFAAQVNASGGYAALPDGSVPPSSRYPRFYTKNDGLLYCLTPFGETPITFEAMAEDCAARGCVLERAFGIYSLTYLYHHGGWDAYQADAADRFHLYAVDAWRRSLHEQAEPVEYLKIIGDKADWMRA